VAPKHGIREILGCASRRHVPFLEASHKLKLRTEMPRELAGVVSFDRQAAAPLGTSRAKRRYDDMSPDPQSPSNRFQVGLSIRLFRQEVKHGPVVPHVDFLRQAQGSHIRNKPSHLSATISHARPSHTDGGLGDVRHDHTAVALIQKPIDKKRRSSPDIDDLAVLRRRNCADQFRSSRRFPLKPAELVGRPCHPHLLPVQSRITHGHFPQKAKKKIQWRFINVNRKLSAVHDFPIFVSKIISPIVPLFNGKSGYVRRAEDYPCDNLNQTNDNFVCSYIADDYR
jgi:hypothetical protein